MGFLYYFSCAFLMVALYPSYSSSIMVKFGTRDGPILPPAPTTQAPAPRRYDPPAPVYENQDDIPNPSTYKPLVPHQYRNKIYKYRPNPNLILGTPLDKKYTPGYDKYDKYAYYLKQKKSLGKTYTGPQFFDVQEYEIENLRKKETQEAAYRTVEAPQQNYDQKTQYVPEIGIVYSSGVRYYVPQIFYYNGDDIDNSVYEANDLKYYYHQKRNY